MNHFRSFATGVVLTAALSAAPFAFAVASESPAKDQHAGFAQASDVPSAEHQLRILTANLNLTSDEQTKIRPILQRLHDRMVSLVEDPTVLPPDRMARIKPFFYKADSEIRDVLTEDQKKKLDVFEREPHPEMHGNLNGTSSSQQQ